MSLTKPNANEREYLIRSARQALLALEALPVLTPCPECDLYRNGWCERWKAAIPPDAQPDGCAEWVETIPF